MSNLNFVNTPLQKLLNKRNIFSRVDALEAKDEAPSLTAESLGEITPDAGDIYVTNVTNVINNTTIGTPAGVSGSLQYNNAGAFGGSADLTWDDAGKVLTLGIYDQDTPNIRGKSTGSGVIPTLYISAGNGITTGQDGGGLRATGGNANLIDNGYGGNASFEGGAGVGNLPGGSGELRGGSGGGTSYGGEASVIGGAGGATSGSGGPANVFGGNAPADGNGGNIPIVPGTGAGGGHVDGVTTIGDRVSNYIQITRAGVQSFVGDAHINFRKRIVTADTTQVTGDYLIIANKATAMSVTLLPAVGSGQVIIVKSIGAGAVTVTADATGTADTIDGSATQIIYQWESIQMMDADTDTWVIL